MGRSVSTHRYAVATTFIHRDTEDEEAGVEFSEFIQDIQENVLKLKYPSMTPCDRWQDREDHVIMENLQVEVSVSEYCGLVAVCLAPLDPDNAFHVAVAERLAAGFEKRVNGMFKSQALASLGRMSNGEQVFQKIS